MNAGVATILIVDDNTTVRKLLVDLLTEVFPGSRLLEADGGENAIELCRVEAPQVVVMDIDMPGISGIAATRRIKALHPDVRIVMYSDHDAQPYRNESASAGASAFVTKSSANGKLTAAIAALLPAAPRSR